jgi:His-Xaa-Ser system protein HxsD
MADEVCVEFDSAIQSIDALRAAAYRLVNLASCQIETAADRLVCKLTPRKNTPLTKTPDADFVRLHFIDLVTDENLRERVSVKTEPVRNLILSLAFGSLAAQGDNKK